MLTKLSKNNNNQEEMWVKKAHGNKKNNQHQHKQKIANKKVKWIMNNHIIILTMDKNYLLLRVELFSLSILKISQILIISL